jgi:type I restriction enzyme R subunit
LLTIYFLLSAMRLALWRQKPEGTILSGVSEQTEKYLRSLPENIPHVKAVLPFAFESTCVETYFRYLRDLEHGSRRVFA